MTTFQLVIETDVRQICHHDRDGIWRCSEVASTDEKTVDLYADAFKHLFEPGVLPVETGTPMAMTVERVRPQ